MEIVDVIYKLIGPIKPVGETHTDNKRMMNLIEFCSVFDKMAHQIWEISREKDSHMGSCKDAGQYAHAILDNLKKSLQDDDLVSWGELLEMVRQCERAITRDNPNSYTAQDARNMIAKAERRVGL